jgi:hypothetical protein
MFGGKVIIFTFIEKNTHPSNVTGIVYLGHCAQSVARLGVLHERFYVHVTAVVGVHDLCGLVRLWCGCGAVMVRLWCGCGAVVVRLWCGYGAIMVRLWCGYGAVMVRLWCGCGAVMVRLWCGYGAIIVRL